MKFKKTYKGIPMFVWIIAGVLVMGIIGVATTTITDISVTTTNITVDRLIGSDGENITFTGILELIDTAPAGAVNKGLQLRADDNETGTAIVFWDHPNSTDQSLHLLGEITGHGTAVGSGNNEIAFYYVNSTGNFQNMFKYLTQRDDNLSLILTGATGISKASGGDIRIGEDVLGGGTSEVLFQDNVRIPNAKGYKTLDTGDTARTLMVLDATNDLYLKNEAAFANTPIIFIQNRDSGNTLTTRVRIDGGDQPNVLVTNANLVTGDEDNLFIVQANTSAVVCNSTNAGGIYYEGGTVTHYGCNSTDWRALY